VPIVVLVDGVYAVVGLVTLANGGFWLSEALVIVLQMLLIAAWLGFLFVRSGRRAT
jgi:hypothetical protein